MNGEDYATLDDLLHDLCSAQEDATRAIEAGDVRLYEKEKDRRDELIDRIKAWADCRIP